MVRICRFVLIVLTVAYFLALALLAIGTFGLFGAEKDPLSAVFLVPLGLPWILMVDGLPEGLRLWAALLAPALNIALVKLVCAALSRSRVR